MSEIMDLYLYSLKIYIAYCLLFNIFMKIAITTKQILLPARPTGMPSLANFKTKTIGNLKFSETIVHGFAQLPAALPGLFKGENTGKMIVEA